jgi:PPOX class probable F420-dependent enzyme
VADLSALEAFIAEPRNVMVAAIRRDGRPQMTPNWFIWDGGRFFISTTKDRAKYRMFRRDPRVQLAIDDATGFRSVLVDGTVEIQEDIAVGLATFRAIRAKHQRPMGGDRELAEELTRERRVLLVITPDLPPEQWRTVGF